MANGAYKHTKPFCKAHGGGVRCQHTDCTNSAEGATKFCVTHGGGACCQHADCTKSAEGATEFCKAHGGGVRCQHADCTKSAQGIRRLRVITWSVVAVRVSAISIDAMWLHHRHGDQRLVKQ